LHVTRIFRNLFIRVTLINGHVLQGSSWFEFGAVGDDKYKMRRSIL
jgi:hypothetical protein